MISRRADWIFSPATMKQSEFWAAGDSAGKGHPEPTKTAGDADRDAMGYSCVVGASADPWLAAGSFISGGERCLALLGSTAALTCYLLIARRATSCSSFGRARHVFAVRYLRSDSDARLSEALCA